MKDYDSRTRKTEPTKRDKTSMRKDSKTKMGRKELEK
jgi:hypothetical protein